MEKPSSLLLVLLLPLALNGYKLLQWMWLFLVHTSRLTRYVETASENATDESESWALVTGASDGIGYGFVEELAAVGFNVIMHGRNKSKLEGLQETIQHKYPARKFRLLVLDVGQRDTWADIFAEFVSEVRVSGLRLRVLINNVGGSGGSFFAFEKMLERKANTIQSNVELNALFPAAITHAVLPFLTAHQPSLMINVGSIAAICPPPYLSLYAGSKAFNLAWSESLAYEMEAEGYQVEVIGTIVGAVLNAGTQTKRTPSLFEPSPRTFAKATLTKVGCGRPTIIPYWPHALQIAALELLPSSLLRKILIRESKKQMDEERRNR